MDMEEPSGSEDVGAEVVERLTKLVADKTTDLADTILQVPLDVYRDPERHEAELDAIFRSSPFAVTPTGQIPNPGDYTVIDVVDRQLLITRDDDGNSHVFLNYCTHRGATIASGTGCTKRHTCPYHAWSFDSAGALVGIPGAEGFDQLDRSTAGLVELPSKEAHGFVWSCLDVDAELDLETHLGPFAAELDRWDYDRFTSRAVMDLEIDSNWKGVVEAFSETYHFPYVHQGTIAGGVIANTNTYDQFGRHHRLGSALSGMADVAAGERDAVYRHDISVIYLAFPSMVLANSPAGVEVVQVTPTADPLKSRLRHTFMLRTAPQDELEEELADMFSTPAADAIRIEDVPVLTTCAQGHREGQHDAVTIGRNEGGVQNIHRQVNDMLAGQPVTVQL